MHRRILVVAASLLCLAAVAGAQLRTSPTNPHWFVDASGKAVVLAGSHTWATLQDNGLINRKGYTNPPPVFDYDAYLDLLARHNHTFFRLWRWETTKWTETFGERKPKYCKPHPWLRTGPGNANDGEPKFDLTRFDPAYFDRLRARVKAAGARGIYVGVMLFEGWELQFTDAWENHPYHAPNNVNGIEADLNGDGKALEYTGLDFGEPGRRVLDLQQAYVRKVVDTLNNLDNVLYEIANESTGQSTEWQYHLIRYIKDYQSRKPKQHPVGMTFQMRGGSNLTLYNSPADWISPNPGDPPRNYIENPCPDCTTKVVLNDTDHLWGHTGGDNIWVWKSFTRGLNVLLMEEMLPSPTWQDSARVAMGQVVRYGRKVNLAAMKPDEKAAATRYCLSDPGNEYLVFQSNKGEFTVDLQAAKGSFRTQWLDVNGNREVPGPAVDGGAVRAFATPFPGPAVLHIKRIP